MKKNILVTTGLPDTWEFSENNFLLGDWCKFYESNIFDEEKLKKKIPKKINFIKNPYHWKDYEKKNKDYKYLKQILEYLLDIISERLSTIHNIDKNKEYWRIIIFPWLNQYITTIFDRWETIRIFFKKNNDKKFSSYFLSLNDLDFLPKNHTDFTHNTQEDEWNHLIFLRLIDFLNIQNLSLIEKKITRNNFKKKYEKMRREMPLQTLRINFFTKSFPLKIRILNLIDNIISTIAFKFNKIIFESFYFPKKEFLKICLRCKLIPSRYSNFFDFDIKGNNLPNDNKRIMFKNLLLKVDTQDKFIKFLLLNLHKDMPKSYLENFDVIKKKILPLAKKRKIIFSMHSIFYNDNFKLYVAETKKIGSKYIFSVHGGGLPWKIETHFDHFKKISDKIITWDNTEQKQNIFVNLSPVLRNIKFKKSKIGKDCSIIFWEEPRYTFKFFTGPGMEDTIDSFNELIQFVNKLNPEIKSKIKFRVKYNFSYNTEKKFSKIFGEKTISKISFENTIEKTILNSKLIIIVTYAQTVFSEVMHSNIPTILIINKNHRQFSKTALHTLNDLEKNQIAFENFNKANAHINKYWKDLDSWWKCKNVQSARKRYLTNFFNVKPDWFKEWSNYVYFSKKL